MTGQQECLEVADHAGQWSRYCAITKLQTCDLSGRWAVGLSHLGVDFPVRFWTDREIADADSTADFRIQSTAQHICVIGPALQEKGPSGYEYEAHVTDIVPNPHPTQG